MVQTKTAALILAVACIASACNEDPSGPVITQLPRQLTVTEQAIIRHSNAFGFDLFEAVYARETDPNVFLSPISASMALGMVMNGAAAQTWDAMRNTLRFDGLSETEINESYRGLMDLLLDLDPRVTLRIGNSVWSRQGVPFHASFYSRVRDYFNAEARELDFSDPRSVDVINTWASDATNGRIPKVLESIEPDHIMFLLNALYFKGQWERQFDPRHTQSAPFRRANGSTVTVPMMRTTESITVPYRHTTDYEAIELAYGGKAFAMLVVLPAPNKTLSNLVASLDAQAWDALVAGLDSAKKPVYMPRFRYEYEELLNKPLEVLGMRIAMSSAANFTRLTPVAEANPVCIHFVKQNTFVEVNEEGTEAAAVTTVGVSVTSAPIPFQVDRPFLFAIRERLSGTILFMGTIGDPTFTKSAPADDPGEACTN